MNDRRARLLLLLPIAALTATALTGCSQIANTLHKTHEETFSDRASAAQGWVGVTVPGWLPADSTDIKNLATTDETNAVVRVTSPSQLPAGCTEADRHGIPFDSPDWAPVFDRFPDRVERCGDYEVLPVEDGWLGWFSATAPGQRPTTSPSAAS